MLSKYLLEKTPVQFRNSIRRIEDCLILASRRVSKEIVIEYHFEPVFEESIDDVKMDFEISFCFGIEKNGTRLYKKSGESFHFSYSIRKDSIEVEIDSFGSETYNSLICDYTIEEHEQATDNFIVSIENKLTSIVEEIILEKGELV